MLLADIDNKIERLKNEIDDFSSFIEKIQFLISLLVYKRNNGKPAIFG